MEQVNPGIWLIRAENKARFPFAHSLYLKGNCSLLIDTGAGSILKRLVGHVDQVLLSHYHRDHVMSNALFSKAAFRIHSLDAPGVKSAQGFFELSGLDRVPEEGNWRIIKQNGFTPTDLTGFIEDGQRIDLGKFTIRIVHTPGHTPGHCAFLIEEYDTVFTADIDLTSFGPWYGNPSSDLTQLQSSISRLRSLKPNLLLTSHSEPVSEDIDRRLARFAAIIDSREEALYQELLNRPKTLDQLIDLKIIFGHHPQPQQLYRFFERNMIMKHLEVMQKKGLICIRESGKHYEVL
jgi:glyoxylase-like metal-dependent hydrolase (beta-lactamase superfamily II)